MDKTSYALGMGIGSQLLGMGADKLNIDDFAQAIKDCVAGKTQLTQSEAQKIAQELKKYQTLGRQNTVIGRFRISRNRPTFAA